MPGDDEIITNKIIPRDTLLTLPLAGLLWSHTIYLSLGRQSWSSGFLPPEASLEPLTTLSPLAP